MVNMIIGRSGKSSKNISFGEIIPWFSPYSSCSLSLSLLLVSSYMPNVWFGLDNRVVIKTWNVNVEIMTWKRNFFLFIYIRFGLYNMVFVIVDVDACQQLEPAQKCIYIWNVNVYVLVGERVSVHTQRFKY